MQTILMCAPTYFSVNYSINPWMDNNIGYSAPNAQKQWANLYNAILDAGRKYGVSIASIGPQKGLPDFVFTANAALMYKNKAIVSTFKHSERQGETEHYFNWFKDNNYDAILLNDENFEGAGDALYDKTIPRLYCGYGWRTDISAIDKLKEHIPLNIVPLNLVNPSFYHLDTCFCPLESGHIMVHLPAFSETSQEWIKSNLSNKVIEINSDDANNFACNAVEINGTIILNKASDNLKNSLQEAGYRVVEVELSDFLKAGGSSKCLTLKLKDGYF